MADRQRSSNFAYIRATRTAFDRRPYKSLPLNFSWVEEGIIAGMGLPTDQAQLRLLKENYNIGMLHLLTPRHLSLTFVYVRARLLSYRDTKLFPF